MKKLKVTTHIGHFQPDSERNLFITVKNEDKVPIHIEQVFIQDGRDVPVKVIQPHRPTPFLLKPGYTWETWISTYATPKRLEDLYDQAYVHARAKDRKRVHIYRSEKDQHVSPYGAIPNGTW